MSGRHVAAVMIGCLLSVIHILMHVPRRKSLGEQHFLSDSHCSLTDGFLVAACLRECSTSYLWRSNSESVDATVGRLPGVHP